jgi:hypothetical protein
MKTVTVRNTDTVDRIVKNKKGRYVKIERNKKDILLSNRKLADNVTDDKDAFYMRFDDVVFKILK